MSQVTPIIPTTSKTLKKEKNILSTCKVLFFLGVLLPFILKNLNVPKYGIGFSSEIWAAVFCGYAFYYPFVYKRRDVFLQKLGIFSLWILSIGLFISVFILAKSSELTIKNMFVYALCLCYLVTFIYFESRLLKINKRYLIQNLKKDWKGWKVWS